MADQLKDQILDLINTFFGITEWPVETTKDVLMEIKELCENLIESLGV